MRLPNQHAHRFAVMMLAGSAALPAPDASAQRYLRAGSGVTLTENTHFGDVDCESTTPAALYGCELGGDGDPLRSAGEFGTTAGLELAAGFAITPLARLELSVEYVPGIAFDGQANFLAPTREQSVTAERSSLTALLAVVIDLPLTDLPGFRAFQPFVGAGKGLVRHRVGETRMTFPTTETIVPGATGTEAAWRLTAGVVRDLRERTALELAWRYTDQGDVKTGEGAGRVQWRDGSRTIPLDLAATRAPVRHHGIALTVRYAW